MNNNVRAKTQKGVQKECLDVTVHERLMIVVCPLSTLHHHLPKYNIKFYNIKLLLFYCVKCKGRIGKFTLYSRYTITLTIKKIYYIFTLKYN